jgi:3-oxoacyl-(acyl-carrier-protein) synthase
MQRMSIAGLVLKPILLEGRFHSRRHENALADILSLCKLNPVLQFPSAERLKVPVRSNTSALLLTQGSLHELALTAILTEKPNWSLTIAEATAKLDQEQRCVLAIGTANFIPQSVLKANKLRVTYLHSFVSAGSPMLSSLSDPAFTGIQALNNNTAGRKTSSDDIAVVGMACRFPGANTIEEFWELLCAGKSMCRELPTSRFSTQKSLRMRSKEVRYWGNFLDEPDVFDHRFFNMSSREASSTDPQQRLVLQVAYEAMESAGHFDELSKSSSIGCYLGVGSVDYHDNVFCHPPTAFSASGTLRAFISGKVSHFFGWTGPSITYDTACSSSAVAIHSACMALHSGECTAALAGGVNLITSPALHQNLDKGGFLSPTGPSKSFDAKADGYCRGEGTGLVVLKKLSAAIVDGDDILGVIAGSAVGQNDNCTPITVPHSQSQAELYKKVTLMAGIEPRDVSFVEAHGTGTKVCHFYYQSSVLTRDRRLATPSSAKASVRFLAACNAAKSCTLAPLKLTLGIPRQPRGRLASLNHS